MDSRTLDRGTLIFRVALGGLAAVYLLQTATRLRLNSDAVRYFQIVTSLADGLPPPPVGFPVGYPAILALLDRAGLGATFWFILANCAFLGAGILALWHLPGWRSDNDRRWTLCLALLAVPVVRSAAMPLPEAAYFGVSLLAVAAMCASTRPNGLRQIALLLAGFLLTAFAISIRTIGMALVPALIWACVLAAKQHRAASRRVKVAAAVLGCVLLFALFTSPSVRQPIVAYLDEAGWIYGEYSLWAHLLRRGPGMLHGFGELATNLPGSKFQIINPLFAWIGAPAVLLVLLATRRRGPPGPAGVYLAAFLAILFIWPHHDVRLWMPAIPLLIRHAAPFVRELADRRKVRLAFTAYLLWFTLTGLGALAYTTRISLAGDRFPSLYGTAGGMATPGYEASNPDYNALAIGILERYDGHAKR